MEEQEIQQKFMQFQQLQQHIEQITEHIQKLNQQNMEIQESITALQEYSKVEDGREVLAPIANGIFVKAKAEGGEKLLVNVGANTVVEKTVEQVVGLLEEQQKKALTKIGEAENLVEGFQKQTMEIYEEIQKA